MVHLLIYYEHKSFPINIQASHTIQLFNAVYNRDLTASSQGCFGKEEEIKE